MKGKVYIHKALLDFQIKLPPRRDRMVTPTQYVVYDSNVDHEALIEALKNSTIAKHPILADIKQIIEYLDINYDEFKPDEHIIWHYYKGKSQSKTQIRFLGWDIDLINPETELVGIIKIFHIDDEGFYYTFETLTEWPRNYDMEKIKRELHKILTSGELKRLPQMGRIHALLFSISEVLALTSFKTFFEKLLKLSKKVALIYPNYHRK